ncbi:MAG: Cyclin D1-binding domain-containing protein [Pseudomonadota bacterium]
MKKILLSGLTVGVLMMGGLAHAENEAIFNPATGSLNISRVTVGSDSYTVDMQQQGQGLTFAVTNAAPTTTSGNIDITGLWLVENQCPMGTPISEVVSISIQGSSLTAIKITGDACVPAGQVTFSGTYSAGTSAMTCITGGSSGLGTTPCGLTVVDSNNFSINYPEFGNANQPYSKIQY